MKNQYKLKNVKSFENLKLIFHFHFQESFFHSFDFFDYLISFSNVGSISRLKFGIDIIDIISDILLQNRVEGVSILNQQLCYIEVVLNELILFV